MENNWTGLNVKLRAGCILLFWIGAILVSCKESRRSFCTLHGSLYCARGAPSGIYWCANNNPTESCSSPGVKSFASIGSHKTDAASDWLFIKRHCIGTKGLRGAQIQNKSDNISYRRDFSIYQETNVLFQLKIRGASEKFKNQPRPLLRQRSVHFRQHFWNLSHETVPLKRYHPTVLLIFQMWKTFLKFLTVSI